MTRSADFQLFGLVSRGLKWSGPDAASNSKPALTETATDEEMRNG